VIKIKQKELYDEIYKKPYHVEWLGKYKGYEKQIELATNLVKGRKILDIGCGEGIITSKLKGDRVIGVDISENAIKYAIENYENKRVKFCIASAIDLPFKDNCFDCVSTFEVLEHLTPDNMHKCLSEISRVCELDGRIVISTPNLSSIYYATLNSLGIKHKEHANEMNFIELINVLSEYFTILEICSNMETPWLKKAWFTNLVSGTQKIFLKLFPPMKHLFYSQIYIVLRNTPSRVPECN